jgi:uncharacterized membrane protein YdjX (TVP38/TMEM64 family)
MPKRFLKMAIFCLAVVAAPVIPFLAFGHQLEAAVIRWLDPPPPPSITASATILALALDIALPIPSSVVATLAGHVLGAVAGTLCVWIGLSLGAVSGFGLAGKFGHQLAARFSSPQDLEAMKGWAEAMGPAAIVITRPAPILAEAMVLALGVAGMSWSRFLPGCLLANLGLAIAYAALGRLIADRAWLPAALTLAALLPLALTWALRRWVLPREIVPGRE